MAKPKTKTASQASNDYNRKNYDSFLVTVPKGMREQLKTLAAENGQSLNRFILECVEEKTGLKLTLDNALPWIAEKKN